MQLKANRRLGLILAAVWLCLATLPSIAAQPSGQPQITVQAVNSADFPQVTAYVTVTDGRGIPIEGLAGSAFSLTEDGQPVRGEVAVSPSERPDRPISLVLCLDVSHSLGDAGVEAVQSAALALLDSLPLDAHDRIALVTFGNPNEQSIAVLRGFTDDIAKLRDILTEDIAIGPENAYTAFWGAANKALELLDADPEAATRRRRAVIILTDGRDNSVAGARYLPEDTQVTQEQVAGYARELGVPVYPISFGDNTDLAALEALAVATQGVSYTSATPRDIEDSFIDIMGNLRSEYRIDFTSSLPADDAEHTLQIRVSHQAYTTAADAAFQAVTHPVEVSLDLDAGETLTGSVLIQPDVQAYAPITSGRLEVNGSLLQTFASDPIRYSWDTTSLAPGDYTLELFLQDAAGNTGSDSVTVSVARPLAVEITAPARNARLAGEVEVRVNVQSNAAALNEVALVVDDETVETRVAPESGEVLFTWDASAAGLGGHQLEVVARDTVGNELTRSVVVTTVEPLRAQITAPVANAEVAGLTAVDYHVEAAVAEAATVALLVDEEPYTEVEAGERLVWDTGDFPLGLHRLTLVATDAAGNEATDSVMVSVARPLAVEITAPAAGAQVAGVVAVDFTLAGTPSDVRAVHLLVDDLELETIADGLDLRAGANSLQWDTSGVELGLRRLEIRLIDTRGEAHTDTTFVTVVEPLTVNISTPAGGTVTDGVVPVTYTVAASAAPLAHVALYVDGELYTETGEDETPESEGAYDWLAFQFSLGAHTLAVVATDAEGHTQRDTVEVTVARTISVTITEPAARANVAGEVPVHFIFDGLPIDVASAGFWVEGRRIATLSDLSAGPNVFTWDTSEVELGLRQIEVRVTDTLDTVHTDAIVVNVVEPLSVQIAEPASGATVTGEVTVSYTAVANTGPLVGVMLHVDGAELFAADPPPSNALTWDSGNFALGAHTLAIEVLDASGNRSTHAVDVFVDRSLSLTITSPAPGESVAGPVEVQFTFEGQPTDVSSAYLVVDGDQSTLSARPRAGQNTTTWQTDSIEREPHTLEVGVIDTLGREFRAPPVTVNVVEPLVASIASPARGEVVGGDVAVSYAVEARADPLFDVSLRADGVEVAVAEVGEDDAVPAEGELVWNSDSFALGEHTLELVAADAAGRQVSAAVTVEVYRPLIVAIQQPAGNAQVAGDVLVRFALDGSPADVARAVFLVDDRRVATITGLRTGANTLTWGADAFEQGAHQLEIRLTDTLGDEVNSLVTVEVVAPLVVTLGEPAEENGVFTIPYTVDARAGALASVELLAGGEVVQTLEEDLSPAGELTWSSIDYPLGAHTLEVRATDDAGHEAAASAAITVSRPLGVFFELPAENDEVAGLVTVQYTITGRVTDVRRVALVVGDQRAASTTELQPGSNTLAWDADLAGVGAHLLELQVYDTTGALAATDSLLVEVVPPLEVALVAPVPNAEVAGEVPVRYSVSLNTDAELARLALLVDGEMVVEETGALDRDGALTWDAGAVDLGAHQLELVAEDTAGNTESASASVSVVPPVLLEVLSPVPDETIAGVVTVRYRADANAADLDRAVLLVGGEEVVEASGGEPLEWDTTALPPGVHEVEVRVFDAAGNVATQSLSVTVLPPLVVRILSPEADARVAGQVDVSFTVETNAAALASVTLLVDDEAAATLDAPQTVDSITWDADEAERGAHTLTLRVEDTAGNTDELDLPVVVADALALDLNDPKPGDRVTGRISVRYQASVIGAQLQRVTLRVDGEAVETLASPPAQGVISWDTGDFGLGAHEIEIVAENSAGQTDTTSAEVIVTRPLSVAIVAPVADTQVSETVTVRYRASAALDEIERATLLVNDQEIETVRGPLAETAFTWETEELGAGAFELVVVVEDVTGVEQASEPVKVRVIYQGNNLGLFILALVLIILFTVVLPITLRRRRAMLAQATEAIGAAGAVPAAADDSSAKAYLVAEGGPTSGTRWSLARRETIIGRSRTRADVVVTGRAASRQHARISRRGEDFIYNDLKPDENPSVINGQALTGSHTLREGDVIEVGDTKLRFTREA